MGVTANSIKNLWSAIEHRHRLAHLPSPLAQRMAFKRTFKAVCAVRGAPSRLLFPIGTHHLARMLALVDLSPAQQRFGVDRGRRDGLVLQGSRGGKFPDV